MKSERISARIPPDLKSDMEAEAVKQDCSESRIIIIALKQYLRDVR